MPYAYRKIRGKNAYKVFNKLTGVIHANNTTLDNAKKQMRLLNALDKKGSGLESNLYTDKQLNRMSNIQLIELRRGADPVLLSRIRRLLEGRIYATQSPTQTGQLIVDVPMTQIELPPAIGGAPESTLIRAPSASSSSSPRIPLDIFALRPPEPPRTRPPPQNLILPRRKPDDEGDGAPSNKKPKGGKGVKGGKGTTGSKEVATITQEAKKRGEELKKQIEAIEAVNLKKATEITKKISKKRQEERARIAKEDPDYGFEGEGIKGGAVPPQSSPSLQPSIPSQPRARFMSPTGQIIVVTGQRNIDLLSLNPSFTRIQEEGGNGINLTSGAVIGLLSGAALRALYYVYELQRRGQVAPEDAVEVLNSAGIDLADVTRVVGDIGDIEAGLPQATEVISQARRVARPLNLPVAEATIGRGLPVGELQQFLKNSYEIKPADTIGDFVLDKKLSGQRVQVYKNRNTPQAVVVHRGTKGIQDWYTDYTYLRGLAVPTNTARFKHAEKIQKEAESKYGADNITTLGHSLGALIASSVGQNSKEIINLNKAVSPVDSLRQTSDKEVNIRTTRDPVSALLPLRNSGRTITIPSETLNPFTEHRTDVLRRLPANQIIGKGAGRSRNRVVPVTDEIISDLTDNTPTPRNATPRTDISDVSVISERERRDNIIADLISRTVPIGIDSLLDSLNITDTAVTRVLNILIDRGVSRRILQSVQMYLDRPTPERDPEIFGRSSVGFGVKRGGALVSEDLLTEYINNPITVNTQPGSMYDILVALQRFWEANTYPNMTIRKLLEVSSFIRQAFNNGINRNGVNTGAWQDDDPNKLMRNQRSTAILDDVMTIPEKLGYIAEKLTPIVGGSNSDIEKKIAQSEIYEGLLDEDVVDRNNQDNRLEYIIPNWNNFFVYFFDTENNRFQYTGDLYETSIYADDEEYPDDNWGDLDVIGDDDVPVGDDDPPVVSDEEGEMDVGEGIYGGGLGKKKSPPIKKMVNPWIEHVKAFAAKKNINYSQAMKHPDVKKGYKKGSPAVNKPVAIRETPLKGKGHCYGGMLTHTHPDGTVMTGATHTSKSKIIGKRKPVAVRGRGMPTTREANIAEMYNEIQLGASGGKGYVSL